MTASICHALVLTLLPNASFLLTVVGGIFLSTDQEFGVEELAVSASADLVNRLL
jgi:hypothetical protein